MASRAGDGVVARVGAFGPFDQLSDWAHQHYLDGYSGRAVVASRQAIPVARMAGDERTLRYLQYTCGVALIEQRRWQEAVEAARDLLEATDSDDVPWRAKGLSLLGDAELRLGRVSEAVDALAEAYNLVQHTPPVQYNELSAAMSVGVVLGHAQLFEPADALLQLCLSSPASRDSSTLSSRIARVLVVQEFAVLHATWAVALDLDGRCAAARGHYLRSGELALHMMALADGHDAQMRARGEMVEAFVQLRLGQLPLGMARLRQSMAQFDQRSELPEVHIGKIGLAEGLREQRRFEPARQHLHEVLSASQRSDRVVWELAALTALAELEVAEHGPHPSTPYFEQSRQVATHRLWMERESRFVALRDRIHLRALAAQASQLGREAMIDPLTGLGNRRMLDAGIAESLGGAALFVDVDLFKRVNDSFSHSVGDEVLRRIADILRAHCRTRDVVVRFGGDEFVVLLPLTSASEAAAVGERVRSAVSREDWDDVAAGLRVSVSVGVSGTGPTDRVLKDADAALHESKEAGRNRVTVY